jgi:hypothetical protein
MQPSPELDGDYDALILLTPTRSTVQESTIMSMKPAGSGAYASKSQPRSGYGYNDDDDDDYDIDMRDNCSMQSTTSTPLMTRNPPNDFSSPASSFSFRMPSIIDDETSTSLFGGRLGGGLQPMPSGPRTAWFGGRVGESNTTAYPLQQVAGDSMLLPATENTGTEGANNGSNTPTNSSNNTRSRYFSSPSAMDDRGPNKKDDQQHAPAKRRKSRHVRSTFVLDGNFSLSASQSTFERAISAPLTEAISSATVSLDQQQRRQKYRAKSSPLHQERILDGIEQL